MEDHLRLPDPVAVPIAPIASPQELEAWLRRKVWRMRNRECVALAKLVVGDTQTVREWRRGPVATELRLPTGTPVATFLDRDGGQSDLYDAGVGVGISGNFTTHAGVVMDYVPDGNGTIEGLRLFEIYPGSRGLRKRIYPNDPDLFGTRSACNYCAILGPDGLPLGGPANPLWGAGLVEAP